MTPEEIHTHCLSLPGTTHVVQWQGASVYKIGGKVFAIYAGQRNRVTLKCADVETAEFLIEIGAATRAPHLPRGGWISLALEEVEDAEMAERLTTSARTVRATLPKSAQAKLPPLPDV